MATKKETKGALDNAHWRNQTERAWLEKSGTLEEFRADQVKIETALSLLQGAYANLHSASQSVYRAASLVRSLSKTTNGRTAPRFRESGKASARRKILGAGLPGVSRENSQRTGRSNTHRPARAKRSVEQLQGRGANRGAGNGRPGSYQGDQSQSHELE